MVEKERNRQERLVTGTNNLPINGDTFTIPSQDAMEIRAAWMRLQGVPEAEIAELCDESAYPGSIAEELENLRAAQKLQQQSLTSEELSAFAQSHSPPADW